MKPDQTPAWMQDGHRKLLADVGALSDQALTAPTALPGWTRRYLLSHVAANADALRNLVHWARTGEERRMYVSNSQRDADIAARPGHAWEAKVITAQGLTRSASEIPWMRNREVYIHAIDLGAGTTWTALPAQSLAALPDDVPARRSAKGGGPALAVAATDTGHTWEVAGTGAPGPVSAPLADLAAYLTRRQAHPRDGIGPPLHGARRPAVRGSRVPKYPAVVRGGSAGLAQAAGGLGGGA